MDRDEWTLEDVLADLRAEAEDDMVEAEASEHIGAYRRAIFRRSHGERLQTIIMAAERELGIQPKGAGMSELQWVESTDEKGRTLWYLSNPDDARFYAEVVDVGGGDFWWRWRTPEESKDGHGRCSGTAQVNCYIALTKDTEGEA